MAMAWHLLLPPVGTCTARDDCVHCKRDHAHLPLPLLLPLLLLLP
jgi:hypothetical protein